MANLKNFPSFLLFTTLIVSYMAFTHVYAQKTTNDLVASTCKQTVDPATCVAALGSDPRSSTATNMKGLILIMIDVVKSRFSDSLAYAQQMTQRAHDPDVIRALKECIPIYRVVVEKNVAQAVYAVEMGNPKFGEFAMADAVNEAEACRLAFPTGKMPGPLLGRTKILHGYANVAASLCKILE